jgi:hypothetical protein
MFLSHVWATAQDQVAVIKRQLQALLPGVRVFLDVDDLEDVAGLEKCVQQSAVILLFLSRGYFKSRNCRRELAAMLKMRKPIVLVHESDETKGGAPLEELKEELRRNMHTAELDKIAPIVMRIFEYPLIPWHRLTEFQMVSLKLVSKELLRHSPSSETGEIYVTGEVSMKAPRLPMPVQLYTSPYNIGADRAAAALSAEVELLSHTSQSPLWLVEAVNAVNDAYADGDVAGAPAEARPSRLSVSESSSSASTAEGAAKAAGARSRFTSVPKAGAVAEADTFMLYLNERTYGAPHENGLTDEALWAREELAKEVAVWLKSKKPFVMVHERDPEAHGCEFAHFFSQMIVSFVDGVGDTEMVTPPELLKLGIYNRIATSYYPGAYRPVSIALITRCIIAEHTDGRVEALDRPHGPPVMKTLAKKAAQKAGKAAGKAAAKANKGMKLSVEFAVSHSPLASPFATPRGSTPRGEEARTSPIQAPLADIPESEDSAMDSVPPPPPPPAGAPGSSADHSKAGRVHVQSLSKKPLSQAIGGMLMRPKEQQPPMRGDPQRTTSSSSGDFRI